MEQLDLFETGELQPIQKWLHVWSEAKREAANKKAREDAGKLRGGKPEGGIGSRHFSPSAQGEREAPRCSFQAGSQGASHDDLSGGR